MVVFIFFKDGPYGPPIYKDERGGDWITYAPVWIASDDTAREYATRSCLNRVFNGNVVKVELYPPSYVEVGNWLSIPIRPKMIAVYCSP